MKTARFYILYSGPADSPLYIIKKNFYFKQLVISSNKMTINGFFFLSVIKGTV